MVMQTESIIYPSQPIKPWTRVDTVSLNSLFVGFDYIHLLNHGQRRCYDATETIIKINYYDFFLALIYRFL